MKEDIMPKRTLLTMWDEMTTFVNTNSKIADETLSEFGPSMPEESKDVLEVLTQSLDLNKALIAALNRHPLLKKIILNVDR